MSLHLSASLSPKDLSPEGIADWLAQAEQIVQAQFSEEKTPPAPSCGSTEWSLVHVAQAKPIQEAGR
jgi:hypothetical protein